MYICEFININIQKSLLKLTLESCILILKVKWIRLLYSDFSAFTKDQERLISINGRKLNFLEGMLLMQQGSINNWRSSNFFPLSDQHRIASLITKHSIIYCLEFAKYYDHQSEKMVDKVPSSLSTQ